MAQASRRVKTTAAITIGMMAQAAKTAMACQCWRKVAVPACPHWVARLKGSETAVDRVSGRSPRTLFAHFQWPAIIWKGRGTTNSTETTTVMAPAVERVR